MRSKILAWRKIFSSFSIPDGRQYASKPVRCDAHMNELPIPCTPWQPWYNDKQSFYGKHLAAGIAWWIFSLVMALYTESIYLNWAPPAQPSAPSDMVEECDDIDT